METTTSLSYPGLELELFEQCVRWKAYWAEFIRPFLHGRVAEIGAGIGATTLALCNQEFEWLCVEPDPQMAAQIRDKIATGELPGHCQLWGGVIAGLPSDRRFDTVLYIDVLEHIEDDRAEIRESASRLAPGGHLVVLSPAHDWLFSKFDEHIGHQRRYTRSSLTRLMPQDLHCRKCVYLDSVGMFLSLANRLLLRSSLPTAGQLALWDQRVIPVSRILDPVFRHALGKTIVGVWQREASSLD